MSRDVRLLRRRPAAVGNDGLSLLQEPVGDSNTLVQQPARVLAKIKNQPLYVPFAEFCEVLFDFAAGVLVEGLNVQVHNPRTKPEGVLYALTRDLIADDIENNG